MTILQLLVILTVMLGVALGAAPLARRLHLPLGGVLVLVGFLASELIVGMGYDTGLRWQHFRDLILLVFIPILVFASALQTDVDSLRRHWVATLSLSVPLLLIATLLCGVILQVLMAHPTGFPWAAAMIAAALFVATDPLAVSEILLRHKVPPPVTTLIEGEGMFGDAMAIALYSSIISYALMTGEQSGNLIGKATMTFLWAVTCGAVAGGASAWVLRQTLWPQTHGVERGMVSLVYVYALYLITEQLLRASGVVALLVAGLLLGRHYYRRQDDREGEFTLVLWRFLSRVSYLLLFLLVGATITLNMFEQRWLAMLMAIAAVLLARLPLVYGWLPVQNRILKDHALSPGQLSVIYFGGVRGAVTLALALSLPVELPYWWTIQSMAYGVVLFSLFVQTPLVEILVRKYGERL